MAGGPNCWVNGLRIGAMGCGKEGWGKGVGEVGLGKWGGGSRVGEAGWGKGWNLRNRYRNFRLGCRNSRYDTKSYKSRESPIFGGIPCVMTSRSRKNVIISLKKSKNEMCERFHLIIYARRSSHLENLNMWAHFEFLHSNISLMNGRQVLIFQLGPNICVI